MNSIEGKVLGHQISHPREYAPEILVAVPRYLNREQYFITEDNLPFVGVDAWHAYELGFLTQKGLPVAGLLKLVYACNSESLVESKSFKLYLNSFNMGKYGANRKEGISFVLQMIKNDLSLLLKTEVQVCFYNDHTKHHYDFEDFDLLENLPEVDTIPFSTYTEAEGLLSSEVKEDIFEYKLSTNLLRSNCKITHQPDWGSAFMHIKTKHQIDKIALLKYLVSIRDENHFHEEICEMLFKRLMDHFNPKLLMVSCLYTRRGGIDICPVRANKKEYLPKYIIQSNILTAHAFRQ